VNVRFSALLMIVGCIGTCPASTPKAPTEIVRAQRAEYNAAIAAHDAVRLRTFLAREIRGIRDVGVHRQQGL
jgi:hypothetical protein